MKHKYLKDKMMKHKYLKDKMMKHKYLKDIFVSSLSLKGGRRRRAMSELSTNCADDFLQLGGSRWVGGWQ